MSVYRYELLMHKDLSEDWRRFEIERFYEEAGAQLLMYLRDNPGPHVIQMSEQIHDAKPSMRRYECQIEILEDKA